MPEQAGTAQEEQARAWPSRGVALGLLAVIVLAFMYTGVSYMRSAPEVLARPAGDGVFYEAMVKQLLTRGVYAYKQTTSNAWITPGYPMFLAGVYAATGLGRGAGGPYGLIAAIQLLFAAGSVALTYVIGAGLLGRGPGLLAAGLLAAWPPMHLAAANLVTEPLAMLLFLGYVAVSLRALRGSPRWLWLVSGLLLAAAVMVRPAFFPIGIVPFVAAALMHRREPDAMRDLVWSAALFAAGFAVVVTPWVVRNIVVVHAPAMLSQHSGDPLLSGVDPYYWEMGPAYAYSGPTYQRYMQARQAPKPWPRGYDVSKDTFAVRAIGGMLRRQPLSTVEWFTLGKLRAMFDRTWQGGGGKTLTLTWLLQLVMVGLGGTGVVLAVRDSRLRVLAAMVVIGTAVLLPFVPEPRFVFGMMPLLAVLAAGTMVRAWGFGRV